MSHGQSIAARTETELVSHFAARGRGVLVSRLCAHMVKVGVSAWLIASVSSLTFGSIGRLCGATASCCSGRSRQNS